MLPLPACPQVNVLSKMDLVEQYGDLALPLDFYLQASAVAEPQGVGGEVVAAGRHALCAP